jgi:hypothetical protein
MSTQPSWVEQTVFAIFALDDKVRQKAGKDVCHLIWENDTAPCRVAAIYTA